MYLTAHEGRKSAFGGQAGADYTGFWGESQEEKQKLRSKEQQTQRKNQERERFRQKVADFARSLLRGRGRVEHREVCMMVDKAWREDIGSVISYILVQIVEDIFGFERLRVCNLKNWL